MYALLLFCSSLFGCQLPLGAQEPGSIWGRVVDAETQAPLSGVSVTVLGTDRGVLTGEGGTYRIGGLPPGSYVLTFQHLGYATLSRPDVVVAPGRGTQADAQLTRVPIELQGIVVEAGFFQKSRSQPASVFVLNAEEVRRAPGSAGDISRVLLALPSTAQIMDNANDLFVRGGSPFENGFFIDHIQVPNVNHFPVQGSTGGPIGMVNTDFIHDVRFSAGGFSAAHGDRLSSIVDIQFREGSREALETRLEMSMAGFGLTGEGPAFGQRGSWLLSARKSFLDLLVGAIGTGVAPRYGDLQGKVTWEPNGADRLSLLGLLGQSRISFDRESSREEGNPSYGEFSGLQGTLGLSWRRLWGDRGYSVWAMSLSGTLSRDDWYRTLTGDSLSQAQDLEAAFRFTHLTRLRRGPTTFWEFGGEVETTLADYDRVFGRYTDRLGNAVPRFHVDRSYDDVRVGVFASRSMDLRPWWAVTLGVRWDHHSSLGRAYLSPRLSTSLEASRVTTVNAAVGLYRQRLPAFLLAQKRAFETLPVPQALHLVLGTEHRLTSSTLMSVEAYWKEYERLPLEEEDPRLFVVDEGTSNSRFRGYRTLVAEGRARSYGVELLLQKKLAERFYGLLGASLFRSRYRDLAGVWRNRAHDNRFLFNAVGGYRASHRWELSGRWSLAGGAPYTPFDLAASRALRTAVVDPSRVNAVRFPLYHSLNLRVDHRAVFRRSALTTYLELWNAYGRKNVALYYWDELDNERGTLYQWGFFPVLGMEWKF